MISAENAHLSVAGPVSGPLMEMRGEMVQCTFRFPHSPEIKGISLDLPPYSRLHPESFQLRQSTSGIWDLQVELPASSRFLYSFLVKAAPEGKSERFPDPFNAARLNKDDVRSILETPPAAPYRPPLIPADRGFLESFEVTTTFLGGSKKITVYRPFGYASTVALPLLIIFDADIYLRDVRSAPVLDELIAAGKITPSIVAFVDSSPETRSAELKCNPDFARFIHEELLAFLAERFPFNENIAIGGASFGGLAAAFIALQYPQKFKKVFSQSGSFWFKDSSGVLAIQALVQSSVAAETKFYLEYGRHEIEPRGGICLRDANRQLRETLTSRGFAVTTSEFGGGHGAQNWRITFADVLTNLLKN